MSATENLVGRWVIWENGTDRLFGLATKYDADDDEYYLVANGLIHAHIWVPAAQTWGDPSKDGASMTAPTQYNGKPIPSGTWLANAARVAAVESEAEQITTNPTPEKWTDAVDWLKRLVISDSHRSDRAQTILDALAALTAEREAESANHEATKSALDQAWTDTHALAEMYRFVVKQLADAPHDQSCDLMRGYMGPCDCWKADL
jgi:hypothetical protein